MLDADNTPHIRASVIVTTQATIDRVEADDNLSILGLSRRFVLNEYEDKDGFMKAVNDYVTNTLGDTSENREIKYIDPFYRYISSKSPDQCVDFRFISDTDVDEDAWALLDLDEDDLAVFIAWYTLYEMSDDGVDLTLHKAKQYYIGWFSSEEEFAKHQAESSGELESTPKYLADHIDFEAVGNEMLGKGFFKEANNHYFNNY